ncbi:hypothetical protein ZHAS_00015471 [Anopheles sinensis]|uniref:Uncharacterized protein n=1 Tax=Anopheles sinensis TaxID=74873 RepID=A0A084WAU8_ANOSI|nr:hypothetical protein ZHAS_00015471 [Anopheles sinensis]
MHDEDADRLFISVRLKLRFLARIRPKPSRKGNGSFGVLPKSARATIRNSVLPLWAVCPRFPWRALSEGTFPNETPPSSEARSGWGSRGAGKLGLGKDEL